LNPLTFAPHVILRELGLDFELISVDTPTQKYGLKATGEFQKINPSGKIPVRNGIKNMFFYFGLRFLRKCRQDYLIQQSKN
jgi:hypothetical protein